MALAGLLAAGLVLPCSRAAVSADDPSARRPASVPDDDAPSKDFLEARRTAPRRPSRLLPPAAAVPPAFAAGSWVAQGPGPIQGGQVEGSTMPNREVVGAVHTVVAHPGDASILWVGAANGGIWKTTNATSASPTWTALTDTQQSLSIGALELDPTDTSNNTLVAGIGRYSSFSSRGGARTGLLRTTNGGTSWTALASLQGKNVSGLAPRGSTIVASVNQADVNDCSNIGIFQSTDTGANFTQILTGVAYDLAGGPTSQATLYTGIVFGGACGGANGVFKSTDTGATWTKVSDATMDALIADPNPNGTTNIEIAVGNSGQVYAGIINDGQLAGLFRSGDGGASWTQLDTPSTNEGGTSYGLQPHPKPGGQGEIHFSIRPDPTNANLVYLGGDRQPGNGDTGASFPNSIGATNYTGRLFRVDASQSPGSQATPLTHCSTVGTSCPSVSTTNNSAPHADSRELVVDAASNVIETDDGGVFRRTTPAGEGDWYSVNGNLQVNECHDVAYDSVQNVIVCGTQDVGSAQQTAADGTTWQEINQGDGGDVAVDDTSTAGQSIRYSSSQNLGNLLRETYDASGTLLGSVYPNLTVAGGGEALVPSFTTPLALNAVDPSRLVIGGSNRVYESLDRGDNITQLAGPGVPGGQSAIAYGGRRLGADELDVLYYGNGNQVILRTTAGGTPAATTGAFPGGTVRDIVLDPSDWMKAYVIDPTSVYATSDAGATWRNVTGNLAGSDLRSVVFVIGNPSAIVVGGLGGVFQMDVDNEGVWSAFGSGLPSVLVFDLDYDPVDGVLVAGTLGRGAWKISGFGGTLPTLSIDDVTVTEGNTGTVSASFTVSLSAASSQTVTVDFATADGTATAGSDYTANSGTLTFSPGTTTQPITVLVTGDTVAEPSETFTVNLSAATNATILDGQGVGTIVDDDGALPTLSINDVTVTEGDAGTADAVFAVTLAPPSGGQITQPVTVSYATADGTATAGSDYTTTSGTLTFAVGETLKVVRVPVVGDTSVEADETFAVGLSAASGATISRAQGTGTIQDDDLAVTSFTVSPAVTDQAGTATLSWSVKGATSVAIGGVGTGLAASGSATASFSQTTTYTLTATGPLGRTATAQATVTVLPPPGTGLALPTITDPLAGATSGVSGVTFAWGAVSGASGYDLRIFDGNDGRTVFSGSLAGGGSTSTLIGLPDGLYLFAVRACSSSFSDAACGSFATRDFTVSLIAPTGMPTIAAPADGATLTSSTQTLSWSTVTPDPRLLTMTYEVVLEDLARQVTVLQINVPHPSTSTIFSLPSSPLYRMRVRACQAACGPFSAAVEFGVALGAKPTAAPSVNTPTVTGGNQLAVSWSAVSGADLYQIQVVQPTGGPGGGALTIAARQLSTTSVSLPVPAGQANIVVAACNGDGCGPFSSPVSINPAGPNPSTPNPGTPMAGTVVSGPTVLFTWNRIDVDDGSNTTYRVYVQDLSRQAAALDVRTTDNFYAAYFKAEGARYDVLVIANPGCTGAGGACSGAETAGPSVGFNVAGTSSDAPTMVSPAHNSTLTQGNIQLGWSPVAGATLYEYFVAVQGQGNPTVTGVTPGLFVQVPLATGTGNTIYSGIVRACPAGATCAAGSDAGWGPWSNQAGPGVTNFTVTP